MEEKGEGKGKEGTGGAKREGRWWRAGRWRAS